MSSVFKGLRDKLIRDLSNKGIADVAVLEAMAALPRHAFVEKTFESKAYEDTALPIAEGQTISQPYTVAFQTQALRIKKGDRILEIGTGSGYQCAVLCQMGANVFSVERNQKLHAFAKEKLSSLGFHPVLKCGDGTLGWAAYAPYDGIIVTAGAPAIPEALKQQLAVGGRLVIPVGDTESQRMTLVVRTSETEFETLTGSAFKFVPLIGKQGWKE